MTIKNFLKSTIISAMALSLIPMPFNTASAVADTEIYDAADFDSFNGRTKQDIADKYLAVMNNDEDSEIYSSKPSLKYPYAYGVLSQSEGDKMMGFANFYRWLSGANEYTNSFENSEKLQAGAFVRNFDFSHFVSSSSKPSDMSDEMWEYGANASHNIIAIGYGTTGSITGWINEGYDLTSKKWGTTGHRDTILSPLVSKLTLGYSGYVAIGKMAESRNTFKETFSAFPAPGYMPSDFLNMYESPWSVYINDNVVKSTDDLNVKITNLTTGNVMNRSVSDNTIKYENDSIWYGTSYIIFVQPDDAAGYSYTDNYEVEITGLKNSDGSAAELKYEVDFFNLKDYISSGEETTNPTESSEEYTTWAYTTEPAESSEEYTTWEYTTEPTESSEEYTTWEYTTEPTESSEPPLDVSMWGDVNSDGEVSIADVVLLNKYLVDCANISRQGRLNADCWHDARLSADDSLVILKIIVKTYTLADMPIIPN